MSLVEIPDPPGYKVVAYRSPNKGESYLEDDGSISVADGIAEYFKFIILQPLEVWRDATIDDLRRAPLRAMFRDKLDENWTESSLIGFRTYEGKQEWVNMHGGFHWRYCQVLESPHS